MERIVIPAAVFHGHDHVFVHQEVDGIVYQEVPQPSATECSTRMVEDCGYTHGDVLCSSGHLRIIVMSKQVTVEHVHSYLPQDEKRVSKMGRWIFASSFFLMEKMNETDRPSSGGGEKIRLDKIRKTIKIYPGHPRVEDSRIQFSSPDSGTRNYL